MYLNDLGVFVLDCFVFVVEVLLLFVGFNFLGLILIFFLFEFKI